MYSDMNGREMFRGFILPEIQCQEKMSTVHHVIGEELNTPVKEKSKPEFNVSTITNVNQIEKITSEFMLNNNYNKTATPNSFQQHKQQEQQFHESPSSKNNDLWYCDQISRSSIDSIDDQPVFSPTESTKCSTSSPLLGYNNNNNINNNNIDPSEESFIFKSTPDSEFIMPVKYSQDCEDFTAEINQICLSNEFEYDTHLPNDITLKMECDSTMDCNENFISNSRVLYQDTMITKFTPIQLYDEDTYLDTVGKFSDILIKPDTQKQQKPHWSQTDCDTDDEVFGYTNLLTPAPSSPDTSSSSSTTTSTSKSPVKQEKITSVIVNRIASDSSATEQLVEVSTVDFSQLKPDDDRLHLEHNYNLSISSRTDDVKTITTKRKLVTDIEEQKHLDQQLEVQQQDSGYSLIQPQQQQQQQEQQTHRKRFRRLVPKIKIKIPATMRIKQEHENEKMSIEISTPEITNDILEMENEKFDLIRYINSSQDKSVIIDSGIDHKENSTFKSVETKQQQQLQEEEEVEEEHYHQPTTAVPIPLSRLDIVELIRSKTMPIKRRRISYENPGSVQSTTSICLSEDSSTSTTTPGPATTKRRGRPPKSSSSSTLPSPSQCKDLSEADWRYLEMRNKNNEASRRSRINRKDRELLVEVECKHLEQQYRILHDDEQALIKECAKWRKAVMTLAQL